MRSALHLCIFLLVSVFALSVSSQTQPKSLSQDQAQAQARLLALRRLNSANDGDSYDVLKALSSKKYQFTPFEANQHGRQRDMQAVMDRLLHVILKPSVKSKEGFS